MADNKRRGRFGKGADDSQSIFDLFEPPPEQEKNVFGRVPIIRDEDGNEVDLTGGGEVVEAQKAAEAEAAGLQHWTEPATGQIPAALGIEGADRPGDVDGPAWRGDDPNWTGPDLSDVFADTDALSGGLSETRTDPLPAPRPRRTTPTPEPSLFDTPPGAPTERSPRSAPAPAPAPNAGRGDATRPRSPIGDEPAAAQAPSTGGRTPTGRRLRTELPEARVAPPPRTPAEAPSASERARPAERRLDGIDLGAPAQAATPPPGPTAAPPAPAAPAEMAAAPPRRSSLGNEPVERAGMLAEQPIDRGGMLSEEPPPLPGETYDGLDILDEDEPPGRGVTQRILVGIALAAVVFTALGFGPVPTMVLIGLLTLLATMELFNAMRMAGLRPATLLGLVGSIAVPASTYVRGDEAYPLVVGLAVVFGMLWYLTGADTERPVLNLGLTLTGILWIGGLAGFAALMLREDGGIGLLLAAIIITATSDTLAYLGGRAYGMKPFHVASPNKTWEGTLTGFFGSVLAGFIIGISGLIGTFDGNFLAAVVLGVVIGILAPIGDLAESLVKRDLGVKDMGALLPGHGGVLDRVDGLLFALPGAYYVAVVYQLF
ncbi:MAG: phosphatidate cytidylyltransferase [Actinomycetota bacterium]